MLDMDELPCTTVDGPIRSRFRGLSWDKKYQGWRVRIYYSGKQRHVGRYEDDITAAKAYDKAAVYLYGANAITNFGLSQDVDDPTEVSAFIVLAKEQADQEQAIKGQQRMLGCTGDSCLLKAAHQFLPGSHLLHGRLLQQQQQKQLHCSSVAMPQTVYPQAQLPVMVDSLAWQQQQQQQFYGAGSSSGMQSMTLQQQRQLWVASPGLSQQMVLVSSPAAAAAAAAYNTLGSSMSSASSASTLSAATAAVQSNMSSPAAAGAAYTLCTAPDGQQVLVPISAGNAGSAMPAVYSAADAAMLMQQQHNMLLLNGAATSQPVQLSVQPQLTTIAGHMAAAHMTTEQHQLQHQLQQQLAMSMPMVFGPAGTDCNSMPPASAVAANSAAAALVNMSAASAGHVLTQQTAGAVTNTVSNASATAVLAGNAAAAGSTACATTSFVGDMLRGLDCYTSATVAAAAAAAADRIASPLNPQQQQPQQQQPQQQLQHVLLAGSRAAGGSLADSNSSSCSPMLGVSGMMFEASNLTAHLGNNSRVGQLRSQSGVTSSHNMSCGGARMAASPTCSSSSNGSSSSQGFPANERVMYQVS